ncbi:predicted protein [Nematostella vectensis]|uniref:Fucolectin tachylectin-4 pentraxin-1 domain-containing protein n=1 Tax=Nematostella vectensis TaxID=45351 RepID=A7SMM0_NEMVE|nr:predicted protein [Nematostella vectensis]|eukprot:XP_001627140.1 predicted protein [Nematostella vectensis]
MKMLLKEIFAFMMILLGTKILTINGGNIALRQPTASLNIREGTALPGLANDGDKDSKLTSPDNSFRCFASVSDPTHGGWWRVDLGRTYVVDEVFLISRTDCCPNRLAGLEIRVGDSLVNNGIENPMCGRNITTGPIDKPIYCVPGLRGRYVVLYIPGANNRLEICEVMVNRNPTVNHALNQSTSQSSTIFNAYDKRAVDGNLDGRFQQYSCTHTQDKANPWWRVDLGTRQAVSEVFLVNRVENPERLNNVEVRVGE